jgi:hypothetical protein
MPLITSIPLESFLFSFVQHNLPRLTNLLILQNLPAATVNTYLAGYGIPQDNAGATEQERMQALKSFIGCRV